MVIHKLDLEDFIEEDFNLLAIHSALMPYRIAYFLNKTLDTRFKQSDKLNNFDFYEYEDKVNQSIWSLVANKGYEIEDLHRSLGTTLFSTEEKRRTYLIPEYKKVDYFVKIEYADYNIQNIVSKINTIPQIITTFAVDLETLKSKNNLIFY